MYNDIPLILSHALLFAVDLGLGSMGRTGKFRRPLIQNELARLPEHGISKQTEALYPICCCRKPPVEMALYGEANKSFEDESAYAEFAKQKSHDNLSLYEAESQALALYDQLVELRLEKAILEARQEISSGN